MTIDISDMISAKEYMDQRIKECLGYDPDTGIVLWKKLSDPNAKKELLGKEAGYVSSTTGHRMIVIDDRQMPASRLAFFLHHERWPKGRLRFIDRDVLNTKINNLEEFKIGNFENTKEGKSAYGKAYRAAYPEKVKALDLRKSFGITLEQYEELAKAQNFVCSICKKPETEMRAGKVKALAVDHNHETGKVRGLLCQSCNKLIGLSKEDLQILRAAIEYLQIHQQQDAEIIQLHKT